MKWLFIIPVLLALGIVSITFALQPNSFMHCGVQPDTTASCAKSDAIVVISGGDTEARTQAGIDLYKNGWAEILIFSGAAQDKTGPSNAATMKQQALRAGVPEAAIFVDEEAVNTQQNAQNTQTILKENAINDVILVTSGYHQRRASLEFTKQAQGILIRNYPVINDKDWSMFWWLSPRGWWLAGGEIVKIIAFYAGASS